MTTIRSSASALSHTSAFCWQSDPYPISDFPDKSPAERRFFHYQTIAPLLGASGYKNRADLPACVKEKIAKDYPNEQGPATSVGYKQDAED